MTLVPILGLGAALLTLGGTGLLHASWRSVLPGHRGRLVLCGWLLLLLALMLWIEATGPEFGTVAGLTVPALSAWLLAGSTAETREPKRARARHAGKESSALDAAGSDWRHHLLLFVLAVPFAALAASVISVALAELLPWSELNRTALVGFVMPPLWGLLACWLCATTQLLRCVILLLVAATASALYLFF